MNITNTLLFLLIKFENPLQFILIQDSINKNNSIFAYVVGTYSLTSLGLNEDVKLTKF